MDQLTNVAREDKNTRINLQSSSVGDEAMTDTESLIIQCFINNFVNIIP